MTFLDTEENISRKEAATVLAEATTHSVHIFFQM